jgi:hypothetical protein
MRSRSAVAHTLFRPVAPFGLLALVALGCQGTGDLSGKVTFQSKPVVFGTVLVEGSDGKIAQGNIEADGSYAVRGVALGQARVAVNSPNPKSITLVAKRGKTPQPYPDVPGWFPISKQYEKPSTSGLTYEIKGGTNAINIELK